MTREEAYAYIADPHSIIGVPLAREICEAFCVRFPDHLVVAWRTAQEAQYFHDAYVGRDGPGEGVQSAHLSEHVAYELGVDTCGNRFRSREEQVVFNVAEIHKKFNDLPDKE